MTWFVTLVVGLVLAICIMLAPVVAHQQRQAISHTEIFGSPHFDDR